MHAFQRLLVCSALAFLALVNVATAASAVGLTIGMTTDDDNSIFYLYHTSLSSNMSGPSAPPVSPPVMPTSNGSSILFLNYASYEALMFAPPQGSNREWLIPLDDDSGGIVVHYDTSTGLLQIDQMHGGLVVGPYTNGDIQQILWIEQQQTFYGLSVDEDYVKGELYLGVWADMVDELQKEFPKPAHNITVSQGPNHEFVIEKQTMAVSQQHQLMFFMPAVWNQKTYVQYAVLWAYDIVNKNLSKPVMYRNISSTQAFLTTLVYSEQRNALYAIVTLFSGSTSRANQVLVERIDWTTGAVQHITDAVPVPNAGLEQLSATIDDDSGDLYIVFESIDPNVEGYVIIINTVNVDTKEVKVLRELPTLDTLMGIDLTYPTTTGSSSGLQTQPQRKTKTKNAAKAVLEPRSKLVKRLRQRAMTATQME